MARSMLTRSGLLQGTPRTQRDPYPPPNHYREFPVPDAAITAADGFQRDRTTLSAPESYYRCFSIVIQNLSTADVTVTLPGGATFFVAGGSTSIAETGLSFINEWSATVSADTASGDVRFVERCRSWAGWQEFQQEGLRLASDS